MARKEVVSRKMVVTVAEVMCVDSEKGVVFTKEVTVKGAPKKEKIFIKRIKTIVEDDNTKLVKVLDKHEEVRKAWMPMQEFLDNCYFE